jgi:hypothetical protein
MTPTILRAIARAADLLLFGTGGLMLGAILPGRIDVATVLGLGGFAVACIVTAGVAGYRAETAPDSSDVWFLTFAKILDVDTAAFAFQRVAVSADDRQVRFSGPTVAAWTVLIEDNGAIRERTALLAPGWHVHEIGIDSLTLRRDDADPATEPAAA